MKRRISIEQLMELKEEQQQRLREWWQDEDGDAMYDKEQGECFKGERIDYEEHAMRQKETLPLLNIGQMIELLMSLDIDGEKEQTINDGTMWMNEGLCDSLWSAVKEVL